MHRPIPSRRAPVIALALLSLAACARQTTAAADPACAGVSGETIVAVDGWARPAAAGGVSAAYVTLCNPTAEARQIVGVESVAARAAEIHETSRDENGVSSMRPVSGVEVPAGGSARLAPGGLHVMLMGLTADLDAGLTAEASILLDNGERLTLVLPVGDNAAGPGEHAH